MPSVFKGIDCFVQRERRVEIVRGQVVISAHVGSGGLQVIISAQFGSGERQVVISAHVGLGMGAGSYFCPCASGVGGR